MTVTINGTSGITTPGLNSTASNVLGDNVADTLNVGNGAIVTDSSGNVGIGTSSPASKLQVKAGTNANIGFNTDSGAPRLDFYNDAASANVFARINSNGIAFNKGADEFVRINTNGELFVNRTTDLAYSPKLQVSGATGVSALGVNAASSGSNLVNWYYNAGLVAAVSTNGSTVTYGTSSDYRLKDIIKPMVGGLDKVMKLKPSTWNWKRDGSDGQGFIAHELQAVVPDCVTGEKDAVDKDGKPVYQGIDTSFLVATLTKAIQELSAKVDAQQAEIEALKGVQA